MRRIACLLLALAPGVARADVVPEAWQAPVLTVERYNEDWSTLADPAQRSGHWTEPLKYIALDAAGDSHLTTGAELRLRDEDYHGDWAKPAAPDNGYLWARLMPYADLHVGMVRAFVQPILAYAAGVRPAASGIDQTRTDMLQAFADVAVDLGGETTLRLRGGRAMMGLGTERLVGTRYGPNVPLAFDGLRAIVHHGALTLNLFDVRPVEPGTGTFDDHTSPTRRLWGAYATRTGGLTGIDLYYLGLRNAAATFEQGTARELRHTLGVRLFGQARGWHWNVEGMDQFGRFGSSRIAAWSVATEVGHGFAALAGHPDLTVRFNVASGDRNAADHRLGTFDAMFPKGKYFGELSPVGPANLVNVQPVLGLDLGAGVGLSLAAAAYWRQSTGDGVYDIPGHLLRTSGTSTARFVGKQVEAAISWRATRELTLGASASWFGTGAFLRQTGLARDIRMTGLEANFRY